MTDASKKLCAAYDQISDRSCRYYADHGGKHNFARLDHDSILERELRQALDDSTHRLIEALDLFGAVWCPEHGHAPKPEQLARIEELRKIVAAQEAPRDLRRELDEMTAARDEACSVAETAIKMHGDFVGQRGKRGSARIIELRKTGAP